MMKKLAAVIAAAIGAGLIVTFVPGFAPEAASGATQVAAAATSDAAIDTAAPAAVVPSADARTGDDIRKAVEQNLRNGSRNPKIICEQSWPYYNSSCLRDAGSTNNPRVVRVIAADRSAAVPLKARR